MTDPTPEPSAPQSDFSRLLRRLPIFAILAAGIFALVYYRHMLSFSNLEHESKRLLALRDAHYGLTSLGFIAIYALVVVISVPGAIILTLSGGFLFGFFPGVVYNVAAATIGAVIVFMAARSGFGHDIAERIEARGGAVARLQAALKENEWSVLLTMRLIPVVPFFIANLIPAFVGIRLSTFAITTFLGIIPADLIYTTLGAGLGEIFARGEVPHLDILFTPKFGLPLVGLGLLAALPLILKLFNRRKV